MFTFSLQDRNIGCTVYWQGAQYLCAPSKEWPVIAKANVPKSRWQYVAKSDCATGVYLRYPRQGTTLLNDNYTLFTLPTDHEVLQVWLPSNLGGGPRKFEGLNLTLVLFFYLATNNYLVHTYWQLKSMWRDVSGKMLVLRLFVCNVVKDVV